MKVGDLVEDNEYPEVGLLATIEYLPLATLYGILCPSGRIEWFTKAYVEESLEVVNESR